MTMIQFIVYQSAPLARRYLPQPTPSAPATPHRLAMQTSLVTQQLCTHSKLVSSNTLSTGNNYSSGTNSFKTGNQFKKSFFCVQVCVQLLVYFQGHYAQQHEGISIVNRGRQYEL